MPNPEWPRCKAIKLRKKNQALWTPWEAFLRDLGCASTKDFLKKLGLLVVFMTCAFITLVGMCVLGGELCGY